MKFVKLFLIAALLIGGFFLLKKAFSPKSDSIDIDIVYDEDLNEYKNQWEAMAQWDSTLFRSQISKINDKRSLGKINESTKENQIRQVHILAKDATCKKLASLYRSAHYNDSAIEANLQGLDVVQRHVDFRNDRSIDTMKQVKKQYFDVKKYCENVGNRGANYYIGKIRFSGSAKDGLSWKSYSDLKSDERKLIENRTTGNVYFRNYLTGNQDLQSLINNAYSNISSYEYEYYNGLKEKIKNVYNNERPEISRRDYVTRADNIRRDYQNNRISLSECRSKLDNLKEDYNSYKRSQNTKLQDLKRGLESTVRKYNSERSDNGLGDFKNRYNASLTEPFNPSNVFKYPN